MIDDKKQLYGERINMSFPYRTLSRERSEIRLIRFVNGPDASDDGSSIELQLCHASLSDNDTPYPALSYT